MITYYDLLGVPPTASGDEIRSAYRAKAKAVHPDRGGPQAEDDIFKLLEKAKTTLLDPAERRRYDAELAADRQGSTYGQPPARRPSHTTATSSPRPSETRNTPQAEATSLPPGEVFRSRVSRPTRWLIGPEAWIFLLLANKFVAPIQLVLIGGVLFELVGVDSLFDGGILNAILGPVVAFFLAGLPVSLVAFVRWQLGGELITWLDLVVVLGFPWFVLVVGLHSLAGFIQSYALLGVWIVVGALASRLVILVGTALVDRRETAAPSVGTGPA